MIAQRDLSLLFEERRVLRGYAEYGDLPEDARVRVYLLDEVAVEKTVALLDRARTEPRDLYDLWFLAAGGHVRLPDLRDLVARKLEFRGWTLAQVGGQFVAKEARCRELWQVRLARRRWPSSRSSRRSTARSGAPCGRAASPAHSRKGLARRADGFCRLGRNFGERYCGQARGQGHGPPFRPPRRRPGGKLGPTFPLLPGPCSADEPGEAGTRRAVRNGAP